MLFIYVYIIYTICIATYIILPYNNHIYIHIYIHICNMCICITTSLSIHLWFPLLGYCKIVMQWTWGFVFSHFSRIRLCVTLWTIAHQAPLSTGFSRQEYCSGRHVLLQGIFPTQGLNLGLLHCRQILYHLSHLPNLYFHLHCTRIFLFSTSQVS